MTLTSQQRNLFEQLKAALQGDGVALDAVFATGAQAEGSDDVANDSTVAGANVTQALNALSGQIQQAGATAYGRQRFFERSVVPFSTGSSTWVTAKSYTVVLDPGYAKVWINVTAIVGGSNPGQLYDFRLLVDGVVRATWMGKGEEDHSLALADEYVSLTGGSFDIVLEAQASGAGNAEVDQWSIQVADTGEEAP